MRIGCCSSLDDIGLVKEAGYDFVELAVGTVKPEAADADYEPVRDLIVEVGIVPEAWNCLLPSDMKVVGPEVDIYRIERYLRTAFQRIGELGGEIVAFGSGAARNIPNGFPMDEAREQMVEFVTLCGRIAGSQGITIAVEPLNSNETNVINTVPEGLELVKSVDHPFVKLLVDLHHVLVENEPLEDIVEAGSEIVHVHVADTGRKHPGSGQYPTAALIEILNKIGYDGRVSVECGWSNFAAECGESLEFLRSVTMSDARTSL